MVRQVACRGAYECSSKVGHFHHKCIHCGSKWSELARETPDSKLLEHMIVMAKRLGMTEAAVLEAWRTEIVKDVMDA